MLDFPVQPAPSTNKLRIARAKPIAPRVRRARGFVQIPLSQVPRRETLVATQKFGAGALVDRVLRFTAKPWADVEDESRQDGRAKGIPVPLFFGNFPLKFILLT
jgi:hypothetical protein